MPKTWWRMQFTITTWNYRSSGPLGWTHPWFREMRRRSQGRRAHGVTRPASQDWHRGRRAGFVRVHFKKIKFEDDSPIRRLHKWSPWRFSYNSRIMWLEISMRRVVPGVLGSRDLTGGPTALWKHPKEFFSLVIPHLSLCSSCFQFQ